MPVLRLAQPCTSFHLVKNLVVKNLICVVYYWSMLFYCGFMKHNTLHCKSAPHRMSFQFQFTHRNFPWGAFFRLVCMCNEKNQRSWSDISPTAVTRCYSSSNQLAHTALALASHARWTVVVVVVDYTLSQPTREFKQSSHAQIPCHGQATCFGRGLSRSLNWILGALNWICFSPGNKIYIKVIFFQGGGKGCHAQFGKAPF